jgi:hypothetical protein
MLQSRTIRGRNLVAPGCRLKPCAKLPVAPLYSQDDQCRALSCGGFLTHLPWIRPYTQERLPIFSSARCHADVTCAIQESLHGHGTSAQGGVCCSIYFLPLQGATSRSREQDWPDSRSMAEERRCKAPGFVPHGHTAGRSARYMLVQRRKWRFTCACCPHGQLGNVITSNLTRPACEYKAEKWPAG